MLIGNSLRGFQYGTESTQGTVVPANKYIPNGALKPTRVNNVKKAMDQGHRNAIGSQRGKRQSNWSVTGQLGYNVLAWIGAGMFDYSVSQAPSVASAGLAWTYAYQDIQFTYHTPATFTFEYGNSLGSNTRFGFGTMTDYSIKISESTCEYSVNGFGAYPANNISLTATPTLIPRTLASYPDFGLFFSTTFGGLSSGRLLTTKDIQIDVKGKYKNAFFIDDTTQSFGGILEVAPDVSGKVTVAKGSESDLFLGALEAGDSTNYIQLKGTGALLATGSPNIYNKIVHTMCVGVETETAVESDSDGLSTGEYNLFGQEDLTNGDLNYVVTCGLATI